MTDSKRARDSILEAINTGNYTSALSERHSICKDEQCIQSFDINLLRCTDSRYHIILDDEDCSNAQLAVWVASLEAGWAHISLTGSTASNTKVSEF